MSEWCGALDEGGNEFLQRPLSGAYRSVWLEATSLKLRPGGQVGAVAALLATGVKAAGRREILGLGLGPAEARAVWVEFLRGLGRRGVRGVHRGFPMPTTG